MAAGGRVVRKRGVGGRSGCHGSGAGDGFVKIEQDAGDGGPRFVEGGGRFADGAEGGSAEFAQEFEEARAFGGGRRAGDAEAEGVIEAGVVVVAAFALHAGGQCAGELKKLAIIEEREGLERGVGAKPARTSAKAVGRIEHGDGGMRGGAPMVRVERAAVAVGPSAGSPGAAVLAEVHDALGLRGKDRWSTDLGDQQPAGGEGCIAD